MEIIIIFKCMSIEIKKKDSKDNRHDKVSYNMKKKKENDSH